MLVHAEAPCWNILTISMDSKVTNKPIVKLRRCTRKTLCAPIVHSSKMKAGGTQSFLKLIGFTMGAANIDTLHERVNAVFSLVDIRPTIAKPSSNKIKEVRRKIELLDAAASAPSPSILTKWRYVGSLDIAYIEPKPALHVLGVSPYRIRFDHHLVLALAVIPHLSLSS